MTIPNDKIVAAAEGLAEFVLTSTGQYHLKKTKYGVEYSVYYLTAGQEVDTAFAVDEFLAGRLTVLEVFGIVRPKPYNATASTWVLARDILRRATRILAEANKMEEEAAWAETLAPKSRRAPHPRSLASRN